MGNDATNSGVLVAAAAKSIQSYVLAGHRVKDMVGASNLIENLSGQLLRQSLAALDVAEANVEIVTASAGGVRMLFRRPDDAAAFCECWPLLVAEFAPGLEISMASVAVPGDPTGQIAGWQEAERRLLENRCFAGFALPPATPLLNRSPAGRPAVAVRDGELQDALAARCRRFDQTDALVARIFPGVAGDRFPRDITLLAGRRYVAVVHVDADAMGKLLQSLLQLLADKRRADWMKRLGDFSKNIDRAADAAVAEATRKHLIDGSAPESAVRLRPIVVAGDDVTVVLPAENAADWVESFATEFEKRANAAVREFWAETTGGDASAPTVSVSAGIAFVKPAFPFWRAYELAESLTRTVKRTKDLDAAACGKSGLAFHRVTTSGLREPGTEFATATAGAHQRILTCCPYRVDDADAEGATTANLRALMKAVDALPRGPLRELLGELYRGADEFNQRHERMAAVIKERGGEQWKNLLAALARITIPKEDGKQFWCIKWDPVSRAEIWRTPLRDALELLTVSARATAGGAGEEAG